MSRSIFDESSKYHSKGKAGKISLTPTKPLLTQSDLALAYSPGVAGPCLEIEKTPEKVYDYTIKGNLVAVISNGTAVLGLGNIGPLASKPVMEGKAVLFKKFADIDAIDLEIDTESPEEFINAVRYLGPSFGGINLEDIKAPECFIIEEKLKSLMNIPVFHDDQHGTAIITAAGLINAADLTNREFSSIKLVMNGAGAAAIACLDLLVKLGLTKENIILCDTKGVIYQGRSEGMNEYKAKYASSTTVRTLAEAIINADVFIGLSSKGALSCEMVKQMASAPIIFAMANPDPEITPAEVYSVRSDAIVATGRSDYHNQLNNLMGFPYIFRGALDVRAVIINDEMKIAAAKALSQMARTPVPAEVYKAYPNRKMIYGPDYIIPVPFDPRLITILPVAVAKAAIDTNVANIKNFDLELYAKVLAGRLDPMFNYMNSLTERVQAAALKRIVIADGEEEEAIKAAIMIRDERLAIPILIGREHKIKPKAAALGINDLTDIIIMNAALSNLNDQYTDYLYAKLQRQGYLYRDCARLVKTDRNVFSSCMVALGGADALITGLNRSIFHTYKDLERFIDVKEKHRVIGYSIMISKDHNLIIADNLITELPSAQDLVEISLQAASVAKNMNMPARVALLSYSNFGDPMRDKSKHIREAVSILDNMNIDFEYEGEITADHALKPCNKRYPFSRLTSSANVLVMPGLHSATISRHLLQSLTDGIFIGPLLDGFSLPVQILPIDASASDIVRIATFAVNDAIKSKT